MILVSTATEEQEDGEAFMFGFSVELVNEEFKDNGMLLFRAIALRAGDDRRLEEMVAFRSINTMASFLF